MTHAPMFTHWKYTNRFTRITVHTPHTRLKTLLALSDILIDVMEKQLSGNERVQIMFRFLIHRMCVCSMKCGVSVYCGNSNKISKVQTLCIAVFV